jgi:nucleoside-diphosphate-sugar epimerase
MGRTNLQPVYVGDVAEACVRVLANPSTQGKIYELGGPGSTRTKLWYSCCSSRSKGDGSLPRFLSSCGTLWRP